MKCSVGIIIAAAWLVCVPFAEAIDITLAEVQNGVAVVQGNKAAKQTAIVWETTNVGQTTKGGGFTFSGVVPADCVGQLRIGTETINVALANCSNVSSAPAPVPQTGQTTSIAPGDDGDLQAGVPLPTPRFTNNQDGTVTDNLTGLIWLRDANCSTITNVNWPTAVSNARQLAHGSCGLSDGSVQGDWRLPNVRELYSLLDFGFTQPVLSNAAGTGHWTEGDAFVGLGVSIECWSSTQDADRPGDVWLVRVYGGGINPATVNFVPAACVWPVRGRK